MPIIRCARQDFLDTRRETERQGGDCSQIADVSVRGFSRNRERMATFRHEKTIPSHEQRQMYGDTSPQANKGQQGAYSGTQFRRWREFSFT
jgi:hypothetical protein